MNYETRTDMRAGVTVLPRVIPDMPGRINHSSDGFPLDPYRFFVFFKGQWVPAEDLYAANPGRWALSPWSLQPRFKEDD